MKVNKYLLPVLVIVALLGTVWVASAAGYWQTRGREMVNLSEGLKSADIKGWMSLRDVSQGTGIPVPQLISLLGLPENTPETAAMKDLEGIISVREARDIIGRYLGE